MVLLNELHGKHLRYNEPGPRFRMYTMVNLKSCFEDFVKIARECNYSQPVYSHRNVPRPRIMRSTLYPDSRDPLVEFNLNVFLS